MDQKEAKINKIKKVGKPGAMDRGLLYLVLFLVFLGVTAVYSASHAEALYAYGNSFYFFRKQIIAAGLGTVILFVASIFKYKRFINFNYLFMGLTVALTIMTMFFGNTALGAKRWISVFGFTFQPAEAIKLLGVLTMAGFLEKNKKYNREFKKGLLKFLGLSAFFGISIALQNDLSTAIILCLAFLVMYYIAGCRYAHIILIVLLGAFAVSILIFSEDYRMDRFLSFNDPESDSQNSGWQVTQSLYALGTGGLTGLGVGQSRQKFSYLPFAYNDFIFSVIGEEIGFVGCCLLILLYMTLIWKCVSVSSKSDTMYGKLIGIGFTAILAAHVIIHIGVATAFFPPTGRALPFISAGGSSLVITLLMMGILLNISKYRR